MELSVFTPEQISFRDNARHYSFCEPEPLAEPYPYDGPLKGVAPVIRHYSEIFQTKDGRFYTFASKWMDDEYHLMATALEKSLNQNIRKMAIHALLDAKKAIDAGDKEKATAAIGQAIGELVFDNPPAKWDTGPRTPIRL